MNISNNSCNEQIKGEVLGKLFETRDIDQSIIAQIISAGKNAGEDIKVANIGQSVIDKLLYDIIPQFNNAGLAFYTNSKVSKAISAQLTTYAVHGQKILKSCNTALNPRKSDEEYTQMIQMRQSSALSRWFANFRKIFVAQKIKSSTINPHIMETVKNNLTQYEELRKKVTGYSLRANIVEALIQEICPEKGFICFAPEVPDIMERDIEPTLIKLGLGDLINQLEERIIAEYERIEEFRLIDCTSQEQRDIYVPNFEKNRAQRQSKENIASTEGQLTGDDEFIEETVSTSDDELEQ